MFSPFPHLSTDCLSFVDSALHANLHLSSQGLQLGTNTKHTINRRPSWVELQNLFKFVNFSARGLWDLEKYSLHPSDLIYIHIQYVYGSWEVGAWGSWKSKGNCELLHDGQLDPQNLQNSLCISIEGPPNICFGLLKTYIVRDPRTSMRKDFNNLCHLSAKGWYKMEIYFFVSLK